MEPITVQVVVRIGSRELNATETADGRDDIVAALNRARDQMVLVLASNGVIDGTGEE